MTGTLTNRPELLLLIRHAQSLRQVVRGNHLFLPADDEAAIRIKGIPDHRVPITDPYGVEQARLTGIGVAHDFGVPDVVYDSEYVRTEQSRETSLAAGYTSEQIARIKVRHNHMLRERDVGYTFFMDENEVNATYPFLRDQIKLQGYFYFRPPGGKSNADLCDQVYPFIGHHLFQVRAGKAVHCYSHGGTIGVMNLLLNKWRIEQWEHMIHTDPPKNCSVTAYRYSPTTRRLELECYNKVYW
ncbi:MAG: histidine phosphatase family protein [Patescibacteria group bacterium]